jgi:carnitine O-octanoyltransferase
LYNTSRVPGVEKDEVLNYFKTAREGSCPNTTVIIGRGRMFYFDFIVNGEILTPQEFLYVFMIARDLIENDDDAEPSIPILTSDDRTAWANNRNHLQELDPKNVEHLKIIESAAMTVSFDENEPVNYSELSQRTLFGDLHSRWNDKSSAMISFRNGKVGLVGEHSCYDGTISISFSSFLLLSMLEEPEPDWTIEPVNKVVPKEISFTLDDSLRQEIKKMEAFAKTIENTVLVSCTQFEDFGKSFMKDQKIHPDSFVQMCLQWAYYKLHGELAPSE